MDDLYRENILDHYRNPRNKGTIEQPTYSHQEHNPLCGDRIRIDLLVNEQGIIEDVKFDGEGCAISQASASLLTEKIKGQPLEYARQLTKQDVLDELGIPIGPVRMKCALLSLKVLKVGAYGLHEYLEEDDEE